MIIPDSVLAAYVTWAVKMHGTAGKDIGDKVDHPDKGEQIGTYDGGTIWRVADGWGEAYFADPKKGEAKYVCSKMPDVMAVDVAAEFRDTIRHKEIGMGDAAWDKAVVDALGGKLMAEKSGWSGALVDGLPDSSFAYVQPGGTKDQIGRTAPLSLRCLPYKSATGEVDLDQLAAALEAVPQVNLPASTKKRIVAKLEAVAARHALVEKYITHSGDKWTVHAESGKVLGTHGSKADAVRQLAAVEANKRPKEKFLDKDVHWPVDHSRFRGSSMTDAGERAPNQPRKSEEDVEKAWSDEARAAALEARRRNHTADTQSLEARGWKRSGVGHKYTHPDKPGHSIELKPTDAPTEVRGVPLSHSPTHWRPSGSVSTHDSGKLGAYLDTLHRAARGTGKSEDEVLHEKFLGDVREAVKAEAGPGSRVQTLVFDKEKYKDAGEAKGWASDHGFKSEKVDETGESFRLRQEDPGAFVRMRTISLTEGVQAVVGFPKAAVKAVQDAFFTTASGRLAFKAEDLAAAKFEAVEETKNGTVYRVKVGAATMHFAESGGVAAHLPMYQELLKTSYVPISKSSDEKRYTLGVVYPASKKGKPEPDFHGDVMSEDEIEKSAWGFMSKGNDRVGLMHRPGTTGAGRVVESYVYRGPSYKLKDATGAEQEISPGDWMLGVVWEPEAWQAIKSGTITGYSLQGAARKEAVT